MHDGEQPHLKGVQRCGGLQPQVEEVLVLVKAWWATLALKGEAVLLITTSTEA